MDPTIYTMGDPMIVREALFALAAIFNSADWFNAGNGFGMGGNLLAAALIGLIGILIAGINTQSMRVDYLLTAFVLFGIAFGTKVNVNIEDIQTGNAAVVDDVPVGVADPAQRISETRERTNRARTEKSTPYVQIIAGAMNLMPRWYIGSVLRKVDFLASDVPGVPVPVYLAGAKVRVQYAFGPTIGSAVNVTLLTYCDTCALGIDVDTGAIPDFEEFYDCLVAGFDEVLALAD